MRSWFTGIIRDKGINVYSIADTVTANSRVVASVSEVNDAGEPLIGRASLSVNGVAPHDEGFVEVEVNIQWGSPVKFRITCFVDP